LNPCRVKMRMISVNRGLFHYAQRIAGLCSPLAVMTVALVVLLGGVEAPCAEPAAHSGPRGLLWKIEARGRAPSYVFGTIHLADPRVTKLPPPVRDVFDHAEGLLVEVVPDAAGLAQLARSMRFDDGQRLKQTVGARLYDDTRAAMTGRGMPVDDIDGLKPWAATLLLLMPDVGDAPPLDLLLQTRAVEQRKTVTGLETMAEQIRVFDELTLEEQRALLAATLRERAQLGERIEALVRAYLARDLVTLEELSDTAEAGINPALRKTVKRRLLTDRNQRMVERMQSWLRRGNVFVAVGAAHLPGPEGILKLLEREGYRVSAVY
jgi:uncharacterized protein